MNAETLRLRSALVEMRGWVRHWSDDVACGLKPTPTSLQAVEAIVDAALEPPVRKPATKSYHNGKTTYRVGIGDRYYLCTPREYELLQAGETAADLELQPAPDEDE